MLKVDQYEYIRTAHRVYGKTIRQIARETGHSRNTVKRALREQHRGYKRRQRQVYPVLDAYLTTIDRWLKADRDKPKKQRHTARRIYHRLKNEHGYAGCESSVRRYVREARIRLGTAVSNVFIPLEAELGKEAEVDWGQCHAILSGEKVRLKMFCMRSKGSGKHFVRCFPCERQQAFFEGHIEAFNFFGGIFPTLIYDNLSSAVVRVLRGKNRKLQEKFINFKAYYSFTPRFCNVNQGHEKGGVEGLVGYSRRNYMVPVPEATDLDTLNRDLLQQCYAYGGHRIAGRSRTVAELYEQEKDHLIRLTPVPFDNVEICSGKVDKYATVSIDKNRYSVPTLYAGTRIKSLLYVDRLEIFHGNKQIAVHRRLYGNNKWQLDPLHYLELIYQRPLAFDSSRAIRQWRKRWPGCLEQLLTRFRDKLGSSRGTREFISVLQLFGSHAPEEIISAVKTALDAGVSSSEAVIHLLSKNQASIEPLPDWRQIPAPDVGVYDQIGGRI
jgi:transposase